MSAKTDKKILTEKRVTYTLIKDGQFFIVENVPAHIDTHTGEHFFSPQTVEHLQQIILMHGKPVRTIETPVFKFV